MSANFTPDFKGYTSQGAFRFWCQTALPLIYDDSLSYYELLNKMVVYLNNVISDVGNMESNVNALLSAYNQLQEYVNTYFDNLDVQEEINNKLDAMALDGSLLEVMKPYIDPVFDEQNAIIAKQNQTIANQTLFLNQKTDEQDAAIAVLQSRMDTFANLPTGSVTTDADAELVDIRVGYDGTTYSTAGNAVRGQVSDLNSALDNVTGNTRNLIKGVLRRCSINENGVISGSENNYDMYYAPVTSGQTYCVTTNDSAGLVCGFYASVPAVGNTSSSGTRTVQANKYITAPTTGYIAFRTMADYQYAQIEDGTLGSAYIKPYTAEDLVARENLSNNNAVLKILCNNSRNITNLLCFEEWEIGSINSDGTDGTNTHPIFPYTIRTVGYYRVSVGSVLIKPNGFYIGIVKYNATTHEKITTRFWITSDEVFPFEEDYVYRIVISDYTNQSAGSIEWVNDVQFEFDNDYKVRNVSASLTSLATLLKPGTYNISSTVFDNLLDAPSDASRNVYNLYVNSKAWAGHLTLQRLECFDGKIWERTLSTSTGSVAFDWKRADAEYIFSQQPNGNPLYGKKLVTAGDSYTAAVFSGDYASYNGKNYGYYIAQRNNMTFVNSGISGSTMAVSNAEDPTKKSPFSYQRYLNVPADTDYLTLWFGINDSAYCEVGTIDDTEDTTFYGAWNKVLQYYLTNRPFMKILIIVTTIGFGDATKCAQIQQAIRDVAIKWGYPYMDWMKDTSIPAFFEKEGMSSAAQALRKAAFGWNGPVNGHPNPEWHEYESSIIEARLKAI